MYSITTLFAKSRRVLAGSGAALIIGTTMIHSAGAADIITTYNNSCAACHDSGALNAVKKGDSAAWQQQKQQKDMPALIDSVKGGMIQMPAGGLCDNCSDDEYRQLIEYMSK